MISCYRHLCAPRCHRNGLKAGGKLQSCGLESLGAEPGWAQLNRSLRNVLVNVALALASSALTLLAVEAALRLADKPGWDSEIRAGWKSQAADRNSNELGYRGQPIRYTDRDIVVVLLGDSQVESEACPRDMMPERYLEKHLSRRDPRFRVFTLGSSGYGNDQEYLALKEYFKTYRADAVVLWETFPNDVWNNVFPTNWPRDGVIKPTFRLEHGSLQGPSYQLGELIRRPARTKIGVLVNRWLHPQKGLDEAWERYLPKPYEPLARYDGKYVTDWDPSDPNNKNPYLQFENLKNEKTHFSVDLYPRSERMQYGLDLTRKLLGRISDTAAEHRSSFFIFAVLNPDEQRMSKNKDADDVIVHKRDGLFYRTSFKQTMANMAYANEGYTFFTLPVLLDKWKVSDTDRHLNCAANDQVMRDLAAKLVQHLRIGSAAQ